MKLNALLPTSVASFLAICAVVVPAMADGAAPPPAAAATFVLAQGTPVSVVLNDNLKSGATKEGTAVSFSVNQDVYSGDHANLLIPAGSVAVGTVTKSSRHGVWGHAGKLEFTCDYVLLQDQTHVPLQSSKMSMSGHPAPVILDFIFTGLLGAYFIEGSDVSVDKGKVFTVEVDQDTPVAASTPSNATPPSIPQTSDVNGASNAH